MASGTLVIIVSFVIYLVLSHCLNQCWIIANLALINLLQWYLTQSSNIVIHKNAFEISAILLESECVIWKVLSWFLLHMKICVRLCRCLIYIQGTHTHMHWLKVGMVCITPSASTCYFTIFLLLMMQLTAFYRSLHSPAPIDPVHVPTLYDPEDCLETWSISPLPHVDNSHPIKTSASESGGHLKKPMGCKSGSP